MSLGFAMNPLSDQELTSLLDDLESDRIERKKAWAGDAPTKARQAVCAFANDLPNYQQPGIIFIGANDDGSVANIEVNDQLLLTLSDKVCCILGSCETRPINAQ